MKWFLFVISMISIRKCYVFLVDRTNIIRMSSYFRRVFSIRTKSISDSDKRIENKPIVANIYVDRVLLQYLGMKDNEKKSRLLISSKEEKK